MDADEFRAFGRAAVDFVADYLENIRERCVSAFVSGYLVRSAGNYSVFLDRTEMYYRPSNLDTCTSSCPRKRQKRRKTGAT